MNDSAARAEILSRELDAAFRNRADLYRLFYDELCAHLGPAEARASWSRWWRDAGQGGGRGRLSPASDRTMRGRLARPFSPSARIGGRMYPTHVKRSDHS